MVNENAVLGKLQSRLRPHKNTINQADESIIPHTPHYIMQRDHDRQSIFVAVIRDALQRGKLTGSERFRQEISQRLSIIFSNKDPGRPKKT